MTEILDFIADAFVTVDRAWRVTYANRRAAELTGHAHEAVVGQPLWTLFPSAVGTSYQALALQAMEEGHPVDFEVRLPPPSSIWAETRIYPTPDGAAIYLRDASARRAAESALRRSEAARTAIMDVSLDAVVMMDHEGMITEWNRAAEQIFGFTREEAVGREMRELIIPPAYREAHRAGLQRFLASGEARVIGRRVELEALRADGTIIPVELAITVLPHSTPPRFAGFLRDISARRAAEAELHRLLAENQAARAEAVQRADEATRLAEQLQDQATELEQQTEEARVLAEELERANSELQRALRDAEQARHQAEQVLAQLRAIEQITDVALAQQDYEQMLNALLTRLRETLGTDAAAVLLLSADNRELIPRASVGLEHAEQVRRLPVGRGITGRVAATGERLVIADTRTVETVSPLFRDHVRSVVAVPLRVHDRVIGVLHVGSFEPRHFEPGQVRLVELVAERMAGALERSRLYDAAQAANRAKSSFLATMSHELRTPLNAIGGYAQLLEMGTRGPVNEEQRRDLERIRRSQDHLLALIEDILHLSRIEIGQVRYSIGPVDMHELLGSTGALIEPQARAKGVRYEFGGCAADVVAQADPDRTRQIVLNLLSNAVKFTAEGGLVELTCAADDAQVIVRVRDTGIGIAADRHEDIFQPFVQLDTGFTRTAAGTGLGLTISRDLARGMGGEITVESEPGRGSVFTLTLPRAAVPAPSSAAADG